MKFSIFSFSHLQKLELLNHNTPKLRTVGGWTKINETEFYIDIQITVLNARCKGHTNRVMLEILPKSFKYKIGKRLDFSLSSDLSQSP